MKKFVVWGFVFSLVVAMGASMTSSQITQDIPPHPSALVYVADLPSNQ